MSDQPILTHTRVQEIVPGYFKKLFLKNGALKKNSDSYKNIFKFMILFVTLKYVKKKIKFTLKVSIE